MKGTKGILYTIIFSALIFLKASGFHVYSHQTDGATPEECASCEYVLENQQNEFAFYDDALFEPEVIANPSSEVFVSNTENEVVHRSAYHLFSRPPPIFTC